MAIRNPPQWIQAGSYSARDDRTVISGLFSEFGVTDRASLAVTQTTTPSMSVNIGDGPAYVGGSTIAWQGCYHVLNDATTTLPLTPSNPTQPRIDLIVLRVYDAEASGSLNEARFESIVGTPAAIPIVPTLPPNSTELARVTVPAGTTGITSANIDSSFKSVAAFRQDLAGPRVVLSTRRPVAPAEGRVIFESDTERLYQWDGEEWSYRGGGNGQKIVPPIVSYSPIFRQQDRTGATPLSIIRTPSGRYALTGSLTNAVVLNSFAGNFQYDMGVIAAAAVPATDVVGLGVFNIPNVGVFITQYVIRGRAASSWSYGPGTIIWQPMLSSPSNLAVPASGLEATFPYMEWDAV